MSRRNRHAPLQPVDELRWLVLRNQLNRIEWEQLLLPQTDLTEALKAGRQRLVEEGSTMDELKPLLPFVFGQRGQERICLLIEAIPPGSPTVGHGTYLGGRAPGR